MVPASAITWPCIRCSVPSAEISARMLADSGRSTSISPSLRRMASRMSRDETWRASMPTARTPSPSGRIAALSTQGRSGLSDARRKITPPCGGRVRLTLMRLKVQCLPLRWSSTVRLPFLRPSSRRSWPSRPVAPSPSIQASRPATSCEPGAQRARRHGGESAGWPRCAAASVGGAVAIGRLLAPANTVTLPSVSMRTAISAPTRLRLCARTLPVSRLDAGNADFRLRRARHHRAVGVAHDDVAQAQRGAAVLVALDLRAADRRRSACRRNSARSPPSATASPCRVRSGRSTDATTGRQCRPRRWRRRACAPQNMRRTDGRCAKTGPRRGAVRSSAGGRSWRARMRDAAT